MKITEPTTLMTGLSARLNSTGFVAVDLGYQADPVAFTPEVLVAERKKYNLKPWMWDQEYERDFQASSGRPVFLPEWLAWQEQFVSEPAVKLAYRLTSDGGCELYENEDGGIWVYVWPYSQPPEKPSHIESILRGFACGMDIGEGVGRSDSTIVGLTSDNREQAWEFASNRITPTDIGKVAAAAALWYNQALINCVRKMHGLTTIREIVDHQGYYRLWRDTIKATPAERRTDRLGWAGGETSSEILFGPFRKALAERQIIIRSPRLLAQLKQYVFDERGRMTHVSLANEPIELRERHGDLVVAAALAWRAVCDLPKFAAQVPVDEAPYQSVNWRRERWQKAQAAKGDDRRWQ